MVSLATRVRYIAHKLQYTAALAFNPKLLVWGFELSVTKDIIMKHNCVLKTEEHIRRSLDMKSENYKGGAITDRELSEIILKNFYQGRLTYLHWNKFPAPTIVGIGETLLVRKLPTADPRHVFVGDLVVLKDPKQPDNYLVRRLTAIEGYEMVSTDEKDEPFVLEKDRCWVVADNENLKAKEADDSRSFGPVNMTDIVGRVIYCLRNAVEHGRVVLQHGRVQNSDISMQKDSPVLAVELDVEEMSKSHRA